MDIFDSHSASQAIMADAKERAHKAGVVGDVHPWVAGYLCSQLGLIATGSDSLAAQEVGELRKIITRARKRAVAAPDHASHQAMEIAA